MVEGREQQEGHSVLVGSLLVWILSVSRICVRIYQDLRDQMSEIFTVHFEAKD